MDKIKVKVKLKVKKKATANKKQFHLITDLANQHRDTTIHSFDTKEEVQDYVIDELENQVQYDFDDGDDIIIYGELLKVSISEKTFKVNMK